MNRSLLGWFGALAAFVASLVFLAACGSGAVSAPPSTSTGPITITPSVATLFSDLPSSFFVSGGNGNYIVASSDQAAIRVAGPFTGNELVIIPNPVAADTEVTLTVTDSVNTTPATAKITVKPRTVNNVLTITPSSTQSAACGTALCAGGDAEVKAVLTQNALPLTNRAVRFEVLSGDVRVITSPVGQTETLATSTTATTDTTGTARVRIRALLDAPAQTALLQVTDLASGFIQRASVTIAGTTGSALSASPNNITFQGTAAGTCASDITADVIVSGGRPPYQVSQPNGFQVAPLLVTSAGGRFSITAKGVCTTGTPIAVVDSAGASVTVTVINKLADTTNVPAFTVSPTTVTLSSCTDVANVILVGGSGNYVASSQVGAVSATVTKNASGAVGTIQRVRSGAPGSSLVTVSFSDGRTIKDVTVNLTGEALGTCDSSTGGAIVANPSFVTINACTDTPSVIISGGTGAYSARTSSSALTATFQSATGGNSNILSIRRTAGTLVGQSPSPCPGTLRPGANQCVTVSDGFASALIDVAVTGQASTSTCSAP